MLKYFWLLYSTTEYVCEWSEAHYYLYTVVKCISSISELIWGFITKDSNAKTNNNGDKQHHCFLPLHIGNNKTQMNWLKAKWKMVDNENLVIK